MFEKEETKVNVFADVDRSIRTEKVNRQMPCKFTDAELRALARMRSEKARRLDEADDKKKKIVKQQDEDIADLESEIRRADNKISDGFEYRDTPCEISYHSPKIGSKQLKRLDTGEIVETSNMTGDELQEQLRLDKENTPEPKPDATPEQD